jgi:hypothetical protein
VGHSDCFAACWFSSGLRLFSHKVLDLHGLTILRLLASQMQSLRAFPDFNTSKDQSLALRDTFRILHYFDQHLPSTASSSQFSLFAAFPSLSFSLSSTTKWFRLMEDICLAEPTLVSPTGSNSPVHSDDPPSLSTVPLASPSSTTSIISSALSRTTYHYRSLLRAHLHLPLPLLLQKVRL